MCKNNCGEQDCNGCCDKQNEAYATSQIMYDGPELELPNTGIVIEPCMNLNDVIELLANAIEELNTP